MAGIVALSNYLVQFPVNAWLTWGALTYPVAYFVTDVANRRAGVVRARQMAWVGFVTGLTLSLILAPLRIALASAAAFLASQFMDIAVFNKLRQKAWWKAPFIGSVAASVLDTAIFFSLAFIGTELNWLALAAGDLGVKLLMAFLLLAPYRMILVRAGLLPVAVK
jgi:uncharacterized PurR-regulated membrane protein YhhQ (DUF165 family)